MLLLGQVIALVAKVSPRLQAPIILFQYYNPILRKGPDEYCRQAKQAGAAGPPAPIKNTYECNSIAWRSLPDSFAILFP